MAPAEAGPSNTRRVRRLRNSGGSTTGISASRRALGRRGPVARARVPPVPAFAPAPARSVATGSGSIATRTTSRSASARGGRSIGAVGAAGGDFRHLADGGERGNGTHRRRHRPRRRRYRPRFQRPPSTPRRRLCGRAARAAGARLPAGGRKSGMGITGRQRWGRVLAGSRTWSAKRAGRPARSARSKGSVRGGHPGRTNPARPPSRHPPPGSAGRPRPAHQPHPALGPARAHDQQPSGEDAQQQQPKRRARCRPLPSDAGRAAGGTAGKSCTRGAGGVTRSSHHRAGSATSPASTHGAAKIMQCPPTPYRAPSSAADAGASVRWVANPHPAARHNAARAGLLGGQGGGIGVPDALDLGHQHIAIGLHTAKAHTPRYRAAVPPPGRGLGAIGRAPGWDAMPATTCWISSNGCRKSPISTTRPWAGRALAGGAPGPAPVLLQGCRHRGRRSPRAVAQQPHALPAAQQQGRDRQKQ